MYYLRARYYDPQIGRFLGQDPLPAGNLYAYVGNNPVNFLDPTGLCHQQLGWDAVCGMVHDFKEGSNFNPRPQCSSRQITINGVCVTPEDPCQFLCPGGGDDSFAGVGRGIANFIGVGGGGSEEDCFLCGEFADNGIYGWDPNAILAGVTTTIYCATQGETWVIARGDWRVVTIGCAAVGAAAGAGFNIYTP